MNEKTVLILERSSQNLRKISKDGKTILEGVFAEFGVENRNGRIYEEKEYLPHLEYLKKDMANGNLLGELDHPERFEVALSGVSHRISDLWYDQAKRQILGRVEILEGTPKGVIAKSLLDAGVPLSISSRAAGSVNEDKTVQIQQIYTYDLVAKPGFESAELHAVNESANSRVKIMLENLNESFNKHKKDNINDELGIVNENLSIIDVTDKFPSVKLREEARSLIQKNNEEIMKKTNVNEDVVLQNWTEQFNDELSKLNERCINIENAILENGGVINDSNKIKIIEEYIEKIRKIQESAINWQSDIAKAVNKVGNHATKHYNLTKKIVETVDYNAKTLNATQDWVGKNAEVLNANCETVDYNANMLNNINEWTEDIAKSVNKLNEWGVEKAVAINDIHEWVGEQAKVVNSINEWTGSIAKNLNHIGNYTEDMFGRSMSKDDAKKLIEYVELVAESKKNENLKNKIDEMLTKHSITNKEINEATLKPLQVLDANNLKNVGNTKVGDLKKKDSGVNFDPDTKTIIAKQKTVKLKKGSKPKELKVLDSQSPVKISIGKSGKGLLVLDATKSIGKGKESVGGNGPTAKNKSDQNLKLDQKPSGKLKETVDVTTSIKTRSSKLDEKLNKIAESLKKEREDDEKVKTQYPFTVLLSEKERKRFAGLSETDKQKVSKKIVQVPTTESEAILKLWESALENKETIEPRWLELAPKDLKEIYNKSPMELKESLQARAEYFNLDTVYQINDFWEKSGLEAKPFITLNENVTANPKKSTEVSVDPFIAGIAEQMKRFQS